MPEHVCIAILSEEWLMVAQSSQSLICIALYFTIFYLQIRQVSTLDVYELQKYAKSNETSIANLCAR